jgi:hypothetical protein
MPGTCSQVLLHIVYSTKYRKPWITADVAERLYPYIGGIVRAEKGTLYHKKEDFKAELLKLLRAHEIEFDERYVFD